MRTQLHNWRILVDRIIEKVWEYIDELKYWDDRTALWVDAESESVILGEDGKTYLGDRKPVEELIVTREDGSKEPDVDAIEEYTYKVKLKKSHLGKQSLTECTLRHPPCQSELAEASSCLYFLTLEIQPFRFRDSSSI